MQAHHPKIVGLGSPLLDMQAEVSADLLAKYGLTTNNTYFATEQHYPLYEELLTIPNFSYVPGGSALNTIRLSRWMLQGELGDVKFIGSVGKDKFAEMLTEVTQKDSVIPLFDSVDQPTGKCAVLLHNKDRSLVPLIGAAAFLTRDYVEKHLDDIKNAKVFFSEVYFLYALADLTKYVYQVAFESGVKTCLTLSSVNAVTDLFEPIKSILPYVDFLFGNEEECHKFGLNLGFEGTLDEILPKIAGSEKKGPRERVVVCTQGKNPTILATKDSIQKIEIVLVDPAKIVDTNSAGDSFCGGFISRLAQGDDLEQAVRDGNYSASQTIQHEGSTIPKYKPYENN